MKFGKTISHEIAICDSEWAPYWIQYKSLKEHIKKLSKHSVHVHDRASKRYQDEKEFFTTLFAEVRKTELFYHSCLKDLLLRRDRMKAGLRILEDAGTRNEADWCRQLQSSFNIFKSAVDLEKYAVRSCTFSSHLNFNT